MPVWAYTRLTKTAMFISLMTADVSQLQLCAEMDLLQTFVHSSWQGQHTKKQPRTLWITPKFLEKTRADVRKTCKLEPFCCAVTVLTAATMPPKFGTHQ